MILYNYGGGIQMIKRLILKVCKITGLTPYDVMESLVSGAITAVLLMLSVYPTSWVIVKIAEMVGLR